MISYTYYDLYQTQMHFIKGYLQIRIPKPTPQIGEQLQVLEDLHTLYHDLLSFICHHHLFSTRPQYLTRIYNTACYLHYDQDFVVEHYHSSSPNAQLFDRVRQHIHQKIKAGRLDPNDLHYHFYEHIVYDTHHFQSVCGFYHKTQNGSYGFFLVDFTMPHAKKKKHIPSSNLKKIESYCFKKYQQYLVYQNTLKNRKTIQDFCVEHRTSYRKLHFNFQKQYGCGLKQFFIQQQLLSSLYLILFSKKNLKEIAHATHFQNYTSFFRIFKGKGTPPLNSNASNFNTLCQFR